MCVLGTLGAVSDKGVMRVAVQFQSQYADVTLLSLGTCCRFTPIVTGNESNG